MGESSSFSYICMQLSVYSKSHLIEHITVRVVTGFSYVYVFVNMLYVYIICMFLQLNSQKLVNSIKI